MRVSTLITTNCPRCAAPVKGDYKYCPECACRLRPEVRPPDPQGEGRGPMVLVMSAVLLVLAGILVGWKIVADRGSEVRVVLDVPPPHFLGTEDIHESLVEVPKGIAWYHRNEEVLTVPPGALEKIVRRLPPAERAAFLEAVENDPEALANWSGVLGFFYEQSEAVLYERTREEPVWVLPFKCMRYEVTRGQYKDFLRAVQKDPTILARLRWVRELWWGDPGPAPDDDADEATQRTWLDQARYLAYLASRYREDWWSAVLEHHRKRDGARRAKLIEEAVAAGRLGSELDDDLGEEERARRIREFGDRMFPPEPPPARPAWLGPTGIEPSFGSLRTMRPDQAVMLLVPPGWIRADESGALQWSIDESADNLPVTDVCYYDAEMYIHWARKETGINRLRLPTWGEWTRAFHGGHATREPDDFNPRRLEGWDWPWGRKVDIHGCNNLNYILNETEPRLRDVRKPYSWHGGRSAEGLMNMAGNAAEWTSNIGKRYLATEDGQLFVTPSGAEEGSAQRAFVCGGSYLDGLDDCKVNARRALFKTLRREWVGFRLVTQSGF